MQDRMESLLGLGRPALHEVARQRGKDLAASRWETCVCLLAVERTGIHLDHQCSSVPHYAERHLGIEAYVAAEMLRVARALEHLPELSEAFRTNQISWTGIREITRCAEPDTDSEWAGIGRRLTAAEIQRLCVRSPRAWDREQALEARRQGDAQPALFDAATCEEAAPAGPGLAPGETGCAGREGGVVGAAGLMLAPSASVSAASPALSGCAESAASPALSSCAVSAALSALSSCTMWASSPLAPGCAVSAKSPATPGCTMSAVSLATPGCTMSPASPGTQGCTVAAASPVTRSASAATWMRSLSAASMANPEGGQVAALTRGEGALPAALDAMPATLPGGQKPRIGLEFRLTPELYEIYRQLEGKIRAAHRGSMTKEMVFEEMCRRAISGTGGKSRTRTIVVLHYDPQAKAAWTETDRGAVPVDPAVVEAAMETGSVVVAPTGTARAEAPGVDPAPIATARAEAHGADPVPTRTARAEAPGADPTPTATARAEAPGADPTPASTGQTSAPKPTDAPIATPGECVARGEQPELPIEDAPARRRKRRQRGRRRLTAATMTALHARSNGRCEVCGRSSYLHVHHCTPTSRGGSDDLEDVRLVCSGCHGVSHRKDLDADPSWVAARTRSGRRARRGDPERSPEGVLRGG